VATTGLEAAGRTAGTIAEAGATARGVNGAIGNGAIANDRAAVAGTGTGAVPAAVVRAVATTGVVVPGGTRATGRRTGTGIATGAAVATGTTAEAVAAQVVAASGTSVRMPAGPRAGGTAVRGVPSSAGTSVRGGRVAMTRRPAAGVRTGRAVAVAGTSGTVEDSVDDGTTAGATTAAVLRAGPAVSAGTGVTSAGTTGATTVGRTGSR
jgi:hypothetical protein